MSARRRNDQSDSHLRPTGPHAGHAERVVLRHVFERRYVDKEIVESVLRQRRRLRAEGAGYDLLPLLADHVSDHVIVELRAVYEEALAEPDASPSSARRIAPPSGAAITDDESSDRPKWARVNVRLKRFFVAAAAGALIVGTGFGFWFSRFYGTGEDIRLRLETVLAAPEGEAPRDPRNMLTQIVALRGQTELPTLRAVLESDVTAIRIGAAQTLALLGDLTVGPALQKLASDEDELARTVGLDCLGRLQREPAFAALEAALTSSRMDVRLYAVDALHRIGDFRAVATLQRMAREARGSLRARALRAVLDLTPHFERRLGENTPDLARTTDRRRPTPSSNKRSPRATAAESARPAAASAPEAVEPTVKRSKPVVVELSLRGSAEPKARSSKGAETPKPEVSRKDRRQKESEPPSADEIAKRDAPGLIAAKRYQDALALLEPAFASAARPDSVLLRLRGLARLGLGSVDDGLTDLHSAVNVDATFFRVYFDLSVAYAVKGQKQNAYNALVLALRLGFRDIEAIRQEERLDDLKETTALRNLMDVYFHSPLAAERDEEERLGFASKRLSAAMRKESDPFLRALAIRRFSEAGGPDATRFLARFLKDRSDIVRQVLAEILGKERDVESVAYLCELVASSNAKHERQALMWTLGDIPGSAPIDALLGGATDSSIEVAVAAAEALGDRPDRRAAAPLIDLLDRAKRLDRLTVAEALAKITGKDLGVEGADWRNFWGAHGQSTEVGPVRNPCGEGSGSSRTVVIPPAFAERMGDAKKRSLARFGGSKNTEIAVAKALEWLARHQGPDGRWDSDEWALRCDERKPWERITRVRQRSWDSLATGAALMAFLGAGHTHLGGPHHETVRRGLEFLKRRQTGDGHFSGDHHSGWRSHQVATIAVTEAFLMTRDCELRSVVERAIGFIVRTQQENGGWGWHARESYTSLTGWNVLALVTASQAGIRAPAATLVSVRDFLDRVTVAEASGGVRIGHAYEILRPAAEVGESLSIEEHEEVRSGGGSLSTTVGLFSRTLLGQSAADPRVSGALSDIRRSVPRHKERSPLSADEWHFFATQAAVFHGGATWKDWNKGMKEALIHAIVSDVKDCERGSWAPSGDYGRVWTTAMAALMLESYYRFHVDTRS